MPCAPADEPALGFQLLSASICAAMTLGVTVSHTDPARITSCRYSAGTLSTPPASVDEFAAPNRDENMPAIMATTARIAASIAISGRPAEVTADTTAVAAARIAMAPARPALNARSRLAVPMRDASSVSACMRLASALPTASSPLPPTCEAPEPMRLPILRLALPAFFSLAILSLARASATRVGPPLAARPAFSFALYASRPRRRAEFSAFRVAPAVRPTAWRPALAPLAAAFAASWPRRRPRRPCPRRRTMPRRRPRWRHASGATRRAPRFPRRRGRPWRPWWAT